MTWPLKTLLAGRLIAVCSLIASTAALGLNGLFRGNARHLPLAK
jgi:hypothetical protein